MNWHSSNNMIYTWKSQHSLWLCKIFLVLVGRIPCTIWLFFGCFRHVNRSCSNSLAVGLKMVIWKNVWCRLNRLWLESQDLRANLLLVEEILHHLGWLKLTNNWIIIILGGAGFCPSTLLHSLSQFARLFLTIELPFDFAKSFNWLTKWQKNIPPKSDHQSQIAIQHHNFGSLIPNKSASKPVSFRAQTSFFKAEDQKASLQREIKVQIGRLDGVGSQVLKFLNLQGSFSYHFCWGIFEGFPWKICI